MFGVTFQQPKDLAWAAGFIDGDGCFTGAGHKSHRSLAVQQVEREPLDRLVAILGVGRVIGPVRNNGFGSRPQWRYNLYAARNLRLAMECLWPFLSGPKREQIRRLFESARAIPQFLEHAPHRGGPRSQVELAWAAGFFDAEGCFCHTSASVLSATLLQTDPEPLERFRVAVGGLGKVYGPYRNNNGVSKRPYWQYHATGHQKVQAILAMLSFQLGDSKRRQGIAALQKARFCRRGHPKHQGHKACRYCTAEYWARRRKERGSARESAVPYLLCRRHRVHSRPELTT